MFEGPVTGNIPEVLDNGEVTDGTRVTAGQLALALTPYALASRDASITALQGAKADATLLASYATNAALSASKTALQSATQSSRSSPPCSFPAAGC